MTSNVGAKGIQSNSGELGFSKKSLSKNELAHKKVLNELKQQFSPEFIGRIDEIITFDALSQQNVEQIAALMLEQLKSRLANLHITMDCSPRLLQHISRKGYSSVYGARPLRREISDTIENFLSQGIFDGKIKADDKIYLDIEDEQIVMK